MARGPGKGKTNNPRGRPRGKSNRTTTELRKAMISFIDANINRLQKDFDTLEPKDRLAFFEKTIRLVLPPPVNPDALTIEQMENLIRYLETKKQNE